MSDTSKPPVAKYRLTLTIDGNSHDEILTELLVQTRGGYGLGDYEGRDKWTIWGGRTSSVLEHTNPDMTPEKYDAELETWFKNRKATNRAEETE